MKAEHKRELKKAAMMIAEGLGDEICSCMDARITDIPEAMMIAPLKENKDIGYYGAIGVSWWGKNTMGKDCRTLTCRNARLLGIAFMLTMPKSFLK